MTAYIEPVLALVEPLRRVLLGLRDEPLNAEAFTCLDEAQILAADWRSSSGGWSGSSAASSRAPYGRGRRTSQAMTIS